MTKLNVGDLVVIRFEPGMEWIDSSTFGRAESIGYGYGVGIVVSEIDTDGSDLRTSYGRRYNYVYRYHYVNPYAKVDISIKMKQIDYTGECNIQNKYINKLTRFQHLHHNIRQIFKLGLMMSDNEVCRKVARKI